jgi:nitroreductase
MAKRYRLVLPTRAPAIHNTISVECNSGKFKPHYPVSPTRSVSAQGAQPGRSDRELPAVYTPGIRCARRSDKWTMPDAIELLRTRRSLKPGELIGPGPSPAEIDTLLTIASRVPDHGKLRPWRFIVFEGEAGAAIEAAFRGKYGDAKPEQVEYERKRLARAPLVIAVVSRAAPHVKIPEWEQVLSAGAAAMSLVLAAHALGYAANWITEWYAYDRGVLAVLGVKENERIAGFIHIGRPAHSPEDRPRPGLEEIATRFNGS